MSAFYFTCDTSDANREGALYLQVEPKMKFGPPNASEALPLDAIRFRTMLAKCLGPLSTREKMLLAAKNSSYKMMRFTPIQVRASRTRA